ncbi:protein-glutamate O-methyltransferase CheR [Stomatohabitans albus]|uniref:CheR family methyltransferase n=1 Tax=Stomatohabitans albus TaxID=3110766 RepID=UPI00300CCB4A
MSMEASAPSSSPLRLNNKVSQGDYEWVREFLRRECAISLSAGKEYLVSSRMTPLIRQYGFNDIAELIEAVRQDQTSPLAGELVDAMTTNETSFFRDVHPFDSLRDNVLPELIPARSATKRLQIWSGACSSGQEPLSIAMLIRENFPELNDWNIQIIGTDISRSILAKAEKGEYSQLEVNRGLPARLLVKYFDRHGARFRVKDELMQMVKYAHLNLAKEWKDLPTFDVIFLRNVLIYFEDDTKASILRQAREHLADDGWLALGGAETTRRVPNMDFSRHLVGRTVWYRACRG